MVEAMRLACKPCNLCSTQPVSVRNVSRIFKQSILGDERSKMAKAVRTAFEAPVVKAQNRYCGAALGKLISQPYPWPRAVRHARL